MKAGRPVLGNYYLQAKCDTARGRQELAFWFSATKPEWSLLRPSSFNTLSTGIHTDSQCKLFWRRRGGLMRNFCPKYGSFVVVMPPLGQQHPPCMTSSQSSSDSQSKNVKTKVIRLLHYCHSETNLRRASPCSRTRLQHVIAFHWPPRGLDARHRLPPRVSLSCQLYFKPALILILSALGDETALHKMFISARNLIWYWFWAPHFPKHR